MTGRLPEFASLRADLEGFPDLVALALDMRWAWKHAADRIWRQIDPELWRLTRNPWVILQTVSRDRLELLLGNAAFRDAVAELLREKESAAEAVAWFQQAYPESTLNCVAYFSMEFMLSEALPIYSGGLGNVAGDLLKAASDLGVPVIGVSLFYQQGYFRQLIDKEGSQLALFPYNDPGQLPITPLREANGEWLRVEVPMPGRPVWLRTWQVEVGRTRLYLLDTNDAANLPAHRGLVSELYGGGPELRLAQEMVLGIGGYRLLTALGIRPDVCHLNEGHTAFAVVERARSFMEESGASFQVALAVTRAGNVFTSHTPVADGFDHFSPALIEEYLGAYARERLGISSQELLALGRRNPEDASESFNTAHLAIRGSGAVNGVSRLHGEVSRRIFAPLFPRWPGHEIPVSHVTNGVHTPSWDSEAADKLWTEACGKERWRGPTEVLEHDIRCVSDEKLWALRAAERKALVEYARERLSGQLAASGAAPQTVEGAKRLFHEDTLTIGFARRFTAYKRPNLLLHDPERLLRLLADPWRPVQLIIAGKAHPKDQAGQDLIRQWTQFIGRPEVRPHAIFLADHDMLLTEHLVQGVDVWINTPRRPWEACGTSGMKVLVNGGVNLSELDGWWAEAYSPQVGWALGDGREHDEDPAWNAAEARALYDLLESEVVPAFYDRDANGIPSAWIARIRESMAQLTPRFSANRAEREYTENYYLPAAARYRARAAGQGEFGRRLVARQRELAAAWPALRFGETRIGTKDGHYAFEVEVYLGGLAASAVRVELYADAEGDGAAVCQEMSASGRRPGKEGMLAFRASVPAGRPASHYTARIVPNVPGAAVPLEVPNILWQR